MEKKAKVTKVTKMDKKDDYGNSSFVIEFENGDKGFFTTKNEDQKNFISGAEATYLIEEKEGRGGKKYCKITLPKTENNWKGNNKPQVDPKVSMISFATSYAKDLIVAGKIDIKDLDKTSKQIFNTMIQMYETIK